MGCQNSTDVVAEESPETPSMDKLKKKTKVESDKLEVKKENYDEKEESRYNPLKSQIQLGDKFKNEFQELEQNVKLENEKMDPQVNPGIEGRKMVNECLLLQELENGTLESRDLQIFLDTRKDCLTFFKFNKKRVGIWKDLKNLRTIHLNYQKEEEENEEEEFLEKIEMPHEFSLIIENIAGTLDKNKLVNDLHNELNQIRTKHESTPLEIFEIYNFGIIEKDVQPTETMDNVSKNGLFRILYPCGSEYYGSFKNNIKEGYGIEIYIKGSDGSDEEDFDDEDEEEVHNSEHTSSLGNPSDDEKGTEPLKKRNFLGIYAGTFEKNRRSGNFVYSCLSFCLLGSIERNTVLRKSVKFIYPNGSYFEGKEGYCNNQWSKGTYYIPHKNVKIKGQFKESSCKVDIISITNASSSSTTSTEPEVILNKNDKIFILQDDIDSEEKSIPGTVKKLVFEGIEYEIHRTRYPRVLPLLDEKKGRISVGMFDLTWSGGKKKKMEVMGRLPVHLFQTQAMKSVLLFHHIIEKNYETVESILQSNSKQRVNQLMNIHEDESGGHNIISRIIREGDMKMLELLLENGVSPNLGGESPLYECVRFGKEDGVDLLLLKHVNIHKGHAYDLPPPKKCKVSKKIAKQRKKWGRERNITPIMKCYMTMNFTLFMKLYENGANVLEVVREGDPMFEVYEYDTPGDFDFETLSFREDSVEEEGEEDDEDDESDDEEWKEYVAEKKMEKERRKKWKVEVYGEWVTSKKERVHNIIDAVNEGWTERNHMLFPKYIRDVVWTPLLHLHLPVELMRIIMSYLPVYKEYHQRKERIDDDEDICESEEDDDDEESDFDDYE